MAMSVNTRGGEGAPQNDVERGQDEAPVDSGNEVRDAAKSSPHPSDRIGSSGHIPRLEEVAPEALDEHSGSSGADADRRAGDEGPGFV